MWSDGRRWMASPAKYTSPAEGLMRCEMALSVLLLPAPLLPSSATIAPCGTLRLTFDKAWMAP